MVEKVVQVGAFVRPMYARYALRGGADGGVVGHAVQAHDGGETAFFDFTQIQRPPGFRQIGFQRVGKRQRRRIGGLQQRVA